VNVLILLIFITKIKTLKFKNLKEIVIFLLFIVISIATIITVVFLRNKSNAPESTEASGTNNWGLIANKEQNMKKTAGALLFAGPPNNNKNLYTTHPNSSMWEWKNNNDVDQIMNELKASNVNVIKLSWWGNSKEKKWSPTIYDTNTHKLVFKEAEERNIMVAPMIEVHDGFKFWQEYPDNTKNLETRIKSILKDYGKEPNYLKIYDKSGNPRMVIWLIETIHVGKVDEKKFAGAFDVVADKIYKDTGYKIGFIIDPTPLPANGSYNGPNPTYLVKTKSLLAINPFNITSDGTNESARLKKAESILSKWKNSGLPLIAPILPGYNDSKVRPPGTKYGNNTTWRNSVQKMAIKYNTVGITLDIWNGFTEGYEFTPTKENKSLNYNLAKTTFSQLNK